MSLRDIVESDNSSVFLSLDDFADLHTVIYNGCTYENIKILLTKHKEFEMSTPSADSMQGLYQVSVVAHISLADMDSNVPEQGQQIQIDDGTALGKPFFKRYAVVSSRCAMGMIVLELEATDE